MPYPERIDAGPKMMPRLETVRYLLGERRFRMFRKHTVYMLIALSVYVQLIWASWRMGQSFWMWFAIAFFLLCLEGFRWSVSRFWWIRRLRRRADDLGATLPSDAEECRFVAGRRLDQRVQAYNDLCSKWSCYAEACRLGARVPAPNEAELLSELRCERERLLQEYEAYALSVWAEESFSQAAEPDRVRVVPQELLDIEAQLTVDPDLCREAADPEVRAAIIDVEASVGDEPRHARK